MNSEYNWEALNKYLNVSKEMNESNEKQKRNENNNRTNKNMSTCSRTFLKIYQYMYINYESNNMLLVCSNQNIQNMRQHVTNHLEHISTNVPNKYKIQAST